MFDVFTEEVEILVKDGIANLYWYKGDLHKAWLRSGITPVVREEVVRLRGDDGQELSNGAKWMLSMSGYAMAITTAAWKSPETLFAF